MKTNRCPVDVERDEAYARKKRKKGVCPDDVLYVGPVGDPSGYGTASREHCLALAATGFDFSIHPKHFTEFFSYPQVFSDRLVESWKSQQDIPVVIYHTIPDDWHDLVQKFRAKYRIGYFAWETDTVPAEWVDAINLMDEIWIPCDANEIALSKIYQGNILKIPHPVVFDIPQAKEISVRGVDPDTFVFTSISHYQGRKNFGGLIAAFCSEFTDQDNVVLILKVGSHTNIFQEEMQRTIARLRVPNPPAIKVIQDFLSQRQLEGLYLRTNTYISLSHAEGFGFGPARAMYLGKPVIASAVPGHLEYCTKKNSFLVPANETPCLDFYAKFNGRMSWHEPDLGIAKKQMRKVFSDPQERNKRAALGQKEIRQHFSYEIIGQKMKSRLENFLEGAVDLPTRTYPIKAEEV